MRASSLLGRPQPGWSHADRLAFCGVAVALLVSLVVSVQPWFDPRIGDACTYILNARALLAGEGYTLHGEPFLHRPPGLSVMLMPLLQIAGTNFTLLHAFISSWGVIAVLLLFVYLRPRLGWGVALAVAVAVMCNSCWRWLGNMVMADLPGMAMVLALLLFGQWTESRRGWWGEVVLGIGIGLAAYVRTLAGLLVPAILVARLLVRRREGGDEGRTRFAVRKLALPATTAMLTILPWMLFASSATFPERVDQIRVHSYTVGMFHQDLSDPASPRIPISELVGRTTRHAQEIVDGLGSRLSDPPRPFQPRNMCFGLLLLGCLLWVGWRRSDAGTLFALLVGGAICVWYVYLPRLILPTFAFALAALAQVMLDVATRFTSVRNARWIAACALLVIAATELRQSRSAPEDVERKHRQLDAFRDAVLPALPPGARLASGLGLEKSIWLERPVYTLSIAIGHAGGDFAGAERLFDKYGINTVILDRNCATDEELVEPLLEHYGDKREVGPALIVRVRP